MKSNTLKNSFLLLSLLSILVSSCAQANTNTDKKIIRVSGKFHENYRVMRLSENVQRVLFVLQHENMIILESAFFLELNPEDSAKLKQKNIVLVLSDAMDRNNVGYEYEKNLSFEITPIPGAEGCYYSDNVDYFNEHNKEKIKDFRHSYKETIFEQPSLKDTIEWSSFSEYHDLRDIPKWVDKLDSKEQVTVHHIGCAETKTGGYAIHSYEKITLAELAKQRLGYASRFLEPLSSPQGEASKSQWQTFLSKLEGLKLEESLLYDEKNHFTIRLKQSTGALYAAEPTTQRIFRLCQQPNYTNYDDQQLMLFDLSKDLIHHGDIFSKDQSSARDFESFSVDNDTIYTINKEYVWVKYVRQKALKDDENDFYKQVNSKNLLTVATDFNISNYYQNNKYTYVLYGKENSSQYDVICLNTKTGQILAKQSLKQTLSGNLPAGKMEVIPTIYGNTASDQFTFVVQIGNQAFQIQLNHQLQLQGKVQLHNNWGRNQTLFQKPNQSIYVDVEEDDFYVTIVDKNVVSPAKIIKMKDHVFDSYAFAEDGENIRAFYEYNDAFSHGVKTALLNASNQYQPEAITSLYSYLPMEELSSENAPTQISPIRYGNKWMVFFMMDSTLNYIFFK